MQKIRPFLWFDTQAEEAAEFYAATFENSRVVELSRYGAAGPGPAGSVMSATFVLDGQEFIALNGGPHFKFSEAISFFISCDSQAEVDRLWERLSEGASQGDAAGSKTNSGCHGRSSRRSSANSSMTRIATHPIASCRPCCAWTNSISTR
jgi:predicted 3-demethylubiquinone-9 3-methyltransferase (glyoxalase superfamily)